jgi:hypothetical protein
MPQAETRSSPPVPCPQGLVSTVVGDTKEHQAGNGPGGAEPSLAQEFWVDTRGSRPEDTRGAQRQSSTVCGQDQNRSCLGAQDIWIKGPLVTQAVHRQRLSVPSSSDSFTQHDCQCPRQCTGCQGKGSETWLGTQEAPGPQEMLQTSRPEVGENCPQQPLVLCLQK